MTAYNKSLEKDVLRIWSVVQQTFSDIPKEFILGMWEEYSSYNNSIWLSLPDSDKMIETELVSFGLYDKYKNYKEQKWKIELIDTILTEADFVCDLAKSEKIIPGVTKVENKKDTLGIINVGKIQLIINCIK